MSRPERVVVVFGTATEIGKTWVTAGVCRSLRGAGVIVAARKPAQSFAPGDHTTDAAVLAEATDDDPEGVCPRHRWYEVPMAPPMAADALGRPAFTVADLAGEIAWPSGVDVGFVETVGGPASPIAADGDGIDLASRLSPDAILLVADAGLGTLNDVEMCVRALLGEFEETRPVIFLNRFDPSDDLHRRNLAWLAAPGADHAGHVETDVAALATRYLP